MLSLLSTILLVVSFSHLVLGAPRGTLLRRRSLDNVFYPHQGDFLLKHSSIAAADKANKKKGKSSSKAKKSAKLKIVQTTPGNGERFGKELTVTTLSSDQTKRVLAATQGEVYAYTFTNRRLVTPPTPTSLSPNFTITKMKAYKNWLIVSSSTNDKTRGMVQLYNLDSPARVYPPIRGSNMGDYLGKSIDIMEDSVSKTPLIVVGGNGFVSTYRLGLSAVERVFAWLPVGGGCLFSDMATGNITGDGFGSQVAFGNDSSGAVLLYIASPLYDKHRRRQMVGRIRVYKLVNDVWQDASFQLGRYRNGKFGSSMKALDNLLLVSTPYFKGYKGAATLFSWNSKKSKLRKQIKLMQPSYDKYQVLFGTSLDLYKEEKQVYMGVGSIHAKYNVGVLQVLRHEKKRALKVAEYMEDKKEDTCGVYEAFALVAGEEEGDDPGIVAGGPYCDEVYVLGEK